MTKVLAKRLERVKTYIIQQSGFVNNKLIGEVIRFIEDVIEYMDEKKMLLQ